MEGDRAAHGGADDDDPSSALAPSRGDSELDLADLVSSELPFGAHCLAKPQRSNSSVWTSACAVSQLA